MSTYDFCENLTNLSISNDIDECIKEWIVEHKGITDSNSNEENRCICNRVIKHYFIIRNINNYNFIKMGSGCLTKLNKNKNNKIDTNSKNIKTNIIKLFEKGCYIKIENINKYAENILIDYLWSKEAKITYIQNIIDIYL